MMAIIGSWTSARSPGSGLELARSLRPRRLTAKHLSLLFLTALTLSAHAVDHVVLVVWDGLRPDSVNTTHTPTLARLASEGTVFANHHSVYITATVVNGVALATGVYPSRSGVLANREYRPNINPLKSMGTESVEAILRGDEMSKGRYLEMPTLAEIVRRAGLKTAISGTKPVVRLFDRTEQDVAISQAKSSSPNTRADDGTTSQLIDRLWDNGVPPFSLLWLSEPDASQHNAGLGSTNALDALQGSDRNLARVLDKLQEKGVRDKTDVFVVSDHGFSTITHAVDMVEELKKAGFPAVREFREPPKFGDILVVGLGGSVLIYVTDHDALVVKRLVRFLQQQSFAGVIFTRKPMPGTFTLDQARLNSSHAPDIVVAMRWIDEPNERGIRGLLVSEGGAAPGRGSHASLSRYDVHNTLIAAGPDFRGGKTNNFPSSNIDLAPTILSVLGVELPQRMDGRLLTAYPFGGPRSRTLKASNGNWHQYLKVTEFGGTLYLDEGNGSSHVVHKEEKRVSP